MLEKMKKAEFEQVYRIMEQSFPENEIRPCAEQKNLIDNPLYSVYILKEKEIKAFIAAWDFCDFAFIEHFAVNTKYRNLGIGSKVLSEFVSAQSKRVCLEVELPNSEIAKRRIGFYERNGFCLNEYDYFQPPISVGKNKVPLAIMTSKDFVTEQMFQRIKDVLYKEVYKYEEHSCKVRK